MKIKTQVLFFISFVFFLGNLNAEDGYRLWLRYDLIQDQQLLNEYKNVITGLMIEGSSPTIDAAVSEIKLGLHGLLGVEISEVSEISRNGVLIAGVYKNSKNLGSLKLTSDLGKLGPEGFIIKTAEINDNKVTAITANEDDGVLYGVFHFLRMLQSVKRSAALFIITYSVSGF